MAEAKTHGPFGDYREVTTKYGTFGIPAGQVLVVTDTGVEFREGNKKAASKKDAEAK